MKEEKGENEEKERRERRERRKNFGFWKKRKNRSGKKKISSKEMSFKNFKNLFKNLSFSFSPQGLGVPKVLGVVSTPSIFKIKKKKEKRKEREKRERKKR